MSDSEQSGLPRTLVTLAVWLGLFGVLWGISAARDIIGPLFAALNLVIAAWPVRTALLKRGASPLVGTLALGLVVFLVLGLAMLALGLSVSALVRELPRYQGRFVTLYNQLVTFAASFGITQDAVLAQLKEISPSSVAGVASSALASVSNGVAAVGVIAIVIFLLLMGAGSINRRGADLAKYQPHRALALGDFVLGVRRYWVVTSVFGLIVAVLDVALLLVLGVPLALVWGVLSFLTNYIPNVGFVIGVIPPALMALLALGPAQALVVVIAYTVINMVIQSFIQPKFNGDAVGVTALVSFLSLLVWSSVLGPLGALLGLPATLLLKAMLVDHDPERRWFNSFLASDPSTADPEDAGVVEQPQRVFVPAERASSARVPRTRRPRRRPDKADAAS